MLQLGEQLRKVMYDHIDQHCLFRANPDIQYFPYTPKGSIIPGGNVHNYMNWCFYLRRLTHNAELLKAISYAFAHDIVTKASIKEEYPNVQLCGLETSSIPLLIATQLAFNQAGINVNSFSIRKERKSYGLCHLIDGIPNEYPVIVIDDVFNSGSSTSQVYDTCFYELGLKPAKNSYFIISSTENRLKVGADLVTLNCIFMKKEFDKKYDPSKYWLPKDCETTHNKRVK